MEEIRANLAKISVVELSEILARSGIRRHPKLTQWTEHRFGLLGEYHIEQDVDRLNALGVKKETLALAMMLINMSPSFDYFFKEMFGDKRVRLRQARSLETAASVLESMAKLIPDMPEMLPDKIPNLSSAAKAVRSYSAMLTWGEVIYAFMGASSIVEVAKYALAGLVRRTTGKFHDREVSALTGAALQRFEYDETAHRVWRIRAYQRLEKSFPVAPLFFQALNDVLSHD